MKTTWLTVIATIEALVILALVLHPRHVEVRIGLEAARIDDPFFWALQYEAPDSKIDELAKDYPKWVSYCDKSTGWSALSESIALGRTNAARILIANGADVSEALQQARECHDERTVRFLEALQAGPRKESK